MANHLVYAIIFCAMLIRVLQSSFDQLKLTQTFDVCSSELLLTLGISNPCNNGVCIVNQSEPNGFICYCHNGFTGIRCSKNFDECLHNNPCKNGATCVNQVPDAKCVCTDGFCGKHCEIEVNECDSNPCQNGARCRDKLNSYQCICLDGFMGEQCEIDINVCQGANSTSFCANGATCVEGKGLEFSCICPVGFTGKRCEDVVDECQSSPCLNEGRCISKEKGDFQCICSFGWTGKTCKIKTYACDDNICKNQGICMTFDLSENFTKEESAELINPICYCPPDYFGANCQNQYNECEPNPCLNDGLCTDLIDNYSCVCNAGFGGHSCEINCSDPVNKKLCIELPIETISSTLPPVISQAKSSSIFYNFSEISSSFSSSFDSISSSIETFSLLFPSFTSQIYSTSQLTTTKSIISSPTTSEIFLSSMFTPLPTPIIPSPINPIFIYRFNGVNSSLVHYIDKHRKNRLNLELRFKNENENAMILYSKGLNNIEIYLYIQNNTLKLNVATDNQLMLFDKIGFHVVGNSFHRVVLDLTSTPSNGHFLLIAVMKFNENQETRGTLVSNESHICFNTFFFGHYPSQMRLPSNELLNQISFFRLTGCIADIKIESKEMFIDTAKKVVEITECDPVNICGQKPCRNKGKCQQNEDNWKCICPAGFMGNLCEEATCKDSPCKNDGICILLNSKKYLCLCNYGWQGDDCEKKVNITAASFTANDTSFIKYSIGDFGYHLQMRFRFATKDLNQKNALLLFMNQNHLNYIIDFFSITLDRFKVYFHIDFGHGIKSVSTAVIENTTEHTVMFGHHKRFIWLLVDHKNSLVKERTPKKFMLLNVSPFLFVGGRTPEVQHPFIRQLQGFEGCIFDVEIITRRDGSFEKLEPTTIDSMRNVKECDLISECKMEALS